MISELLLKKNEGLGLIIGVCIYIYIKGIFVISGYWVFIRARFQVGSRIFL